jgi:hypothetical protein
MDGELYKFAGALLSHKRLVLLQAGLLKKLPDVTVNTSKHPLPGQAAAAGAGQPAAAGAGGGGQQGLGVAGRQPGAASR